MILDTVRSAADPVFEAVEGVERQQDDTPGGGAIDETELPSEALMLSPATYLALGDDVEEVDPDEETTVHDFGVIYNRTAGDVDAATDAVQAGIDDFGAGVTGEGSDGGLGAVGGLLRWAAQNPLVVVGGVLVLYLAPLLTNALGVLDGVVGDE